MCMQVRTRFCLSCVLSSGEVEILMNDIVTGVGWPPFDAAVEAAEIADLTNNMTGALRELAPNSGCYLNEVSISCSK